MIISWACFIAHNSISNMCLRIYYIIYLSHITIFHILHLCKKAGRSANALARLSQDLDVKSKLVLFVFIMSHFTAHVYGISGDGTMLGKSRMCNTEAWNMLLMISNHLVASWERGHIGRWCMYSAHERYLLKSTRHILISAQNIRVIFLRSPIRFSQLVMIRC